MSLACCPRRIRERDPSPPWQYPAFISWIGHARRRLARGRAARSRSRTDARSAVPRPGPHRSTSRSAVVIATLVVQGLSLPAVIRLLGLEARRRSTRRRRQGADQGRGGGARAARRARRRGLGERRHGRADARRVPVPDRRFSARIDPDDDGEIEMRSQKYQRLRLELLDGRAASGRRAAATTGRSATR